MLYRQKNTTYFNLDFKLCKMDILFLMLRNCRIISYLVLSGDKAGAVYVKLANCHLKVSVNPSVVSRLSLLLFSFGLTHKIFSVLESRFPLRSQLDSKHEAANAYADAAHCYKKSNIKGL